MVGNHHFHPLRNGCLGFQDVPGTYPPWKLKTASLPLKISHACKGKESNLPLPSIFLGGAKCCEMLNFGGVTPNVFVGDSTWVVNIAIQFFSQNR